MKQPTTTQVINMAAFERPPRRIRPSSERMLTLDAIRGEWRPSGSVAGCGVFAVVWQTRYGTSWAALHDFGAADQRFLIERCRQLDLTANGHSGASREVG